ncbi:protein NKG7-like [Python bivittatus]|uniref:Protein NKG7-like n=1 Tax=Python bivittatus TaxID=176946 RepID=A0A9F3QUZ6_PYTBI|nr:protein NKG7-like [Python bivittatus]
MFSSSSINRPFGGDRPEHSVEMNALHIGVAVCSCISLLFLLLALGSNNWIENSVTSIGLWNVCVNTICTTYSMDVVPAYFHATRAFLILGMIAGAVSFGGLCIMFSQSKIGNISLSLVSCIASFTAALCVMIAMAVFTAKADSIAPYGWSFGIGWASFPLYLITGGLTYKLHKDETA